MDINSRQSSPLSNKNSEITGSIEENSFSKLLSDLYHNRSTGYLILESEIKLNIQFLHGFVQYVESDDTDLLLGKLLVTNDMISEEDQRTIIDFSREKGIRVGEALIELGKLTPHELGYILDLQMKLKLMNGFRLSEGTFIFTYTDSINTDTYYHINPIQIIYDAIDSYILLKPYDFRDYNSGGTVYPSSNMGKLSDIVLSTSRHYKLADMISEPVSLSYILLESPLDREDTLKFLQFLKLAQFIRIEFNS